MIATRIKKHKNLLFLGLIFIAIFGLLFWQADLLSFNIFQNKYQAVFLTNESVYFGKLYRLDSQFPIMKDVYYIRSAANDFENFDLKNPREQLQLIRLGGEFHSPKNELKINRDRILFIEELTDNSEVVKIIRQRK